MVDLEKSSRQGFIIEGSSNGKQHVSVTVKFICNNQGKTPAKILEKRVCLWLLRLEHALPETPDFEIDSGDPTPHFLGAADKFEREWTAQTEGVPSRDSTMVIYGFVKYQHLFSEHEVRTTFGYQIMPASNRLVRLSKAKYNEIT